MVKCAHFLTVIIVHRKFAPRCCVCREPIMPEPGKEETVRVVALDRSFHVSCYKCEVVYTSLDWYICKSFLPKSIHSRIADCCYRLRQRAVDVSPLTIIFCARAVMQNESKHWRAIWRRNYKWMRSPNRSNSIKRTHNLSQ